MDDHKLRILAEQVLATHRRDDSKALAKGLLHVLDVFAEMKKRIYVTGSISENQFERIIEKLEKEGTK